MENNFQPSAIVGNRADLARLCNTKGLKRGVEIGTDRGLFAREFLERWRGEMLYCVDTWAEYPEMPWRREGDFFFACSILAPFANRCRIVRASSAEVAAYFGKVAGWPADIDFVYIDGAHNFEAAKEDIASWWAIVRQGGILAGDDFDTEHSGVVQAVTEFAETHQLRVDLTTDYNRGPSWYIEK